MVDSQIEAAVRAPPRWRRRPASRPTTSATSQEILGGDKKQWWLAHLNLLRHGGTGNLRTLLTQLAQDWTMLEWLDGVRSSENAPNENFAREFWELFTLGVDNGYTQADIVQAARCFTGYRTRFDDVTGLSRVEFDPNRHDTGDKSILGQTVLGRSGVDGAGEYADMVNLTLAQRPAAEYVVGKLFTFLCYPNPPAEVTDALATLLRASNYELAPVIGTLLKSEAFYSATSKAGLVKSPAEFALGPLTGRLGTASGAVAAQTTFTIINMFGGNDGLSTVVPRGLASYHSLRPTIAIPVGQELSLAGGPSGTTAYGLNPRMTKIQALWNAGDAAIVNLVGYPDPNLSHFESEDIWSFGMRNGSGSLTAAASGWIARYGVDAATGLLTGQHANLMQRLDDAVGAYADDAKAMGSWDRTVIAVISEFGRRNFENGSLGTDHGHGACVLLIGGAVNGGSYGPPMSDAMLQEEQLEHLVDFRDIYREILSDHLGAGSLSAVFPEAQQISTTLGLV